MARFKKIFEVDVNIDHYAEKCKSIAELKKCEELFDTLPKANRTAAIEQLWKEIKPPSAKEVVG